MDFRGIGKLLETMENNVIYFPADKFHFLIDECFYEGITIEDLQKKLIELDKELNDPYRRKKRHTELPETPPVPNARQLERLKYERIQANNTLTINDGPLTYCMDIDTHEASVSCWANMSCIEVNIISPYNIKGEKYFVTRIPVRGFAECYLLKSLIIPYGVTKLFRATFQECFYLEYVKIPASVRLIYSSVFYGCLSLKRVEFENPDGVTIDPHFLSGSNNSVEIVDLSTDTSYPCEEFIAKFGSISK